MVLCEPSIELTRTNILLDVVRALSFNSAPCIFLFFTLHMELVVAFLLLD